MRHKFEAAERRNLVMAALCSGILLLGFVCKASQVSIQMAGFSLPTVCAFKLITRFDCPGCGLTRALSMAIHGHFYQSYMMHIWGIPLFFILLFQVPYRLILAVSPHKTMPSVFGPKQRIWLNHFIFGSLMLPWIAKSIAISVILYL